MPAIEGDWGRGGGGNVSPLAISDPPVLKFYYILVCILVATHKTKVQTKQFQNFLIALIIAYFMRKKKKQIPAQKMVYLGFSRY